jgi:hypothetical protein
MVGKESDQTRIDFHKINKSKYLFILIFIILLGIILRILFINTREIAYDDAFSYFLSIQTLDRIVQGTVADTMPPLYYFLLHFWTRLSTEIGYLRFLNVIINEISIVFAYLLVKDQFNKQTAAVTALFLSICPFLLFHSQELRMYSLLLLGQTGFLYFAYKIVSQSNKLIWYFMAILFGTIAMYSHNLAFIGIIPINIFILTKNKRKYFIKLLFVQIAILLLYVPWASNLIEQIAKVQTAFWTPRPGLLEIIQAVLTLFAFLPMPIPMMAFVLILLLQGFILCFVWLVKQKNKKIFEFVIIGLIPPFILFIMSYLTRPVFVPRIFLLSIVFGYFFVAMFIVNNWSLITSKVILGTFILASVISLPYFYLFQSFPRSSFREAEAYLSNAVESENGIILHDNKLSFFPVQFYNVDLEQFFLPDLPGSSNDTLAVRTQEVIGYFASKGIEDFEDALLIYYVVFEKAEGDYLDLGMEHPIIQELGAQYRIEDKVYFGDLIIYKFRKI